MAHRRCGGNFVFCPDSTNKCHRPDPFFQKNEGFRAGERFNWNFMWAKMRGNWCKLTFGRLNWSLSLPPPSSNRGTYRPPPKLPLLISPFTINSIGQTKKSASLSLFFFFLFLSQTSSIVASKLPQSPGDPRSGAGSPQRKMSSCCWQLINARLASLSSALKLLRLGAQ